MKKKPESTKENQARSPKKPVRAFEEKADANQKQASDADVIQLILRDHKPLKDLIQILKNVDLRREEKEDSFEQFVPLLVAHAKAEEQSLYVQMKEFKDLRMQSFEGDTEHALAEQLVHEINASPDDDEWNAKVKVIAELVEQHIEEEEKNILKEVKTRMELSTRIAVGEIYTQVKMELDILNHPRHLRRGNQIEHRTN